jgi:hypothetical protein
VGAEEDQRDDEKQGESGPAAADERLAAALARGVSRTLRAHGGETLTEFTLRTGRRVDVIAVDDDGRVTIVEIKTSVADFRSDGKWPEYLEFCDYFYFAVPEDFPRELLPGECGVMVADAYEALILTPAQAQPVNGSRRRALILRFARAAAQRLNAYTDPRECGPSPPKLGA